MNPGGESGVNIRINEEIVRYNKILKAVAEKNNVPVNDLYEITKGRDSSYYKDYCHFASEGNRILGETVATALKVFL